MKDSISVCLKHFRVRIETRIAQFCNLLGKQFNSVGGVTEDDGLVDLQLRGEEVSSPCRKSQRYCTNLGEECIQALNLLSFLDKSVVLGDTFQSQLLHEINLMGIVHIPILSSSELVKVNVRCRYDLHSL